MDDLIRGALDPKDIFEIKLEGFLSGEPKTSNRLLDSITKDCIDANKEIAEKRYDLATEIVKTFAELYAKGRIDPEQYTEDIRAVRRAGLAYAQYLMICYADRAVENLVNFIRLAEEAKERGEAIDNRKTQQSALPYSPEHRNVDQILALDDSVRYHSQNRFSTASREVLDEPVDKVA